MRIKRQYLKIAGWILLICGMTSWFAGLILFLLLPVDHLAVLRNLRKQ